MCRAVMKGAYPTMPLILRVHSPLVPVQLLPLHHSPRLLMALLVSEPQKAQEAADVVRQRCRVSDDAFDACDHIGRRRRHQIDER